MEKLIIIADAHSTHKPQEKAEFKLMGGCPWFCYVWVNDVCYTLTKGERTVKLQKTKY